MSDRIKAIQKTAAGHGPGIRLAGLGVAAVGYAFCLLALLRHGILFNGGEGGGDVFAYWTAGSNVLHGLPVYGPGVGGYAAFLYPPPLAQLFAPLSLLPLPVVTWVWRAVELACLRVAVGSWMGAGIALLAWPPVVAEVDAANVHLLIAAAVAMAIRGRPAMVVPVAITKFASLAAVPLAARTNPRGLLLGAVTAIGIGLLSYATGPGLWSDYLRFATHITTFDSGWYNIGAGVPLWVRIGVAAIAALAALRWARLAALAATLALPVLWFHGLSVLVAVVAQPAGSKVRQSVSVTSSAIET